MTEHPLPAPVPSGQPLAYIGNIGVTETEVITPAGRFPLKGTQWAVSSQTRTNSKIPTIAIVLAVVLVLFCFLSLLLLLMKEEEVVTVTQVTVSNPATGFYHVATIPAGSPASYTDVMNQVEWARSLAARL